MQVKRFVAADMRRALQLVRDELGEDAMILSTQRSGKGVELLASLETAETNITPNHQRQRQETARKPALKNPSPELKTPVTAETQAYIGPASGKTRQQLSQELEVARQRMLSVKRDEQSTLESWAEGDMAFKQQRHSSDSVTAVTATTAPSAQLPPQAAIPMESAGEQLRQLQGEIASMRDMFAEQLATMACAQEQHYRQRENFSEILPIVNDIKQRLGSLGLTQTCSDRIIRDLKSVDTRSMNADALWHESLARLARKIPSLDNDPVISGGCFALLGPTGVGKTTTIAKLAARYVIAHGPEKVALLTTDSYRFAAHEQLQSLAAILKVKMQIVDDLQQLPAQLQALKGYDLVLIDTPGMSGDDTYFKTHLKALNSCEAIQSLLVLSVNSQFQMMQASLHRYRATKLQACVLTKLDECASLGDAISFLATNNLPLSYITHGQAVPDDLAAIKPHQLLAKAVALCKLPQIHNPPLQQTGKF
ncbi:MAG: flagellar biosynthesis protein FlhF [Cellvibrionaceae bacterium]|nr:flagellar biosynthesis protein FlhF [Cellvibrionaceae bacterium]